MRRLFQKKLLEVRLIEKGEVNKWGEYLRRYHYLGYKWIPGESLRHVAILDGSWVACIGWGSAALKCSVRDEYIGWNEEKKLKRLYLISNNMRFLVLPWVQIKNLASAILSLNLRRICEDYVKVYGHPVYLAETFVDSSKYKGTCYKAANWKYLGQTRGYSKIGRHYYHNGNPKSVYVYLLNKEAKEMLNSDYLSSSTEVINGGELLSMNDFPVQGLMEVITSITDPRKKQGIRHKIVTILALSVCAMLCGARSYLAIWEWAKGLTKDVLKRFDCDRGIVPSEPTFRRLLQKLNAEEFDRVIGNWLLQQIPSLKDKAIAIDGKSIKGSKSGEDVMIHLLSGVIHKEGIVIAQKRVSDKTNEITVVKPLLKEIEMQEAVITVDALLAQKKIAEYIVEEKKADYVVTIKSNQPTLLKDIKDLNLEQSQPQHATLDKGHGRIEERKIWTSDELKGYIEFPHAEQVFCIKRKTESLDGKKKPVK
ncbi:MAG: hypothetical protein A2Y62_20690 [Candidatus Fischerbacteria bacterium RBG_13_37_8]|uniref:ISAs1 family transposase n=1 Tax=Candidatus Fischerbacteria bacterium RBG_13_37_8 TaxID=1817863 RepID=A0A1F5VEJ1_9BACT|nr:MAG: hypothetical protein A2Y62_20690 [Candidatus Fischerbacteria bacterium RBG_13_37_8]